MKKVLILTAGFGEGHNSAARGIRDGLLQTSNGTVVAEVRDIFSDCYGFLNDWARSLYLALVDAAPETWGSIYRWLDQRNRFAGGLRVFYPAQITLRRLLVRFAPDVVVSVYPAYPHILGDILGNDGVASFKRVVVITDSVTVNAIWFRCAADYFLLPNDPTADVLHASGIPSAKTKVFGFPVGLEFGASTERKYQNGPVRLLYIIGSTKAASPDLALALAALPDVELTVSIGRHHRLLSTFQKVKDATRSPFRIVGWTENMPELLHSHDLLITKAGGATVQEAIAARRPMIINQIVPGQEDGNARLIVDTGSGVVAIGNDAVVRAVKDAMADDAKRLKGWSDNIGRLSRPRAALDIAEFLLHL